MTDKWQKTTIGKIADVSSGATPSRTVAKYWGGNIPWLTTSSIDFGVITKASEMITPEGLQASATKIFPAGTLLMAMYGQGATRGRVAIMGIPAATNQACAAIKPKDCADSRFLFYALAVRYEEIRNVGQGGNQKNLNAGLIRSIEIDLPPLAEQARIVEVLDAADAVVRALDNLIDAKLRHKHAQAERLLSGLCRFPEFKGQEWRDVRLSAFFREKAATAPVGVPPLVLSCSKIHGIVPQSQIFSRSLASKDLKRYKYIEPGDLVFDPMLLWDASIAFSEYSGVVSPAYCTFQFVGADADPRFFRYLFATHVLKHTYKTISQGTNTRRKKAPASDFLNIQVSVPEVAEQRRIADTLSLLDEEIILLRGQHARQKQIKHGLMQSLLLGHARVREFAP